MVDGLFRAPILPGITITLLANWRRHSRVVLIGRRLARFALVDTNAVASRRQRFFASACAVTRTASAACLPRNARLTRVCAGTSQVCGPGQVDRKRSMSCCETGESNGAKRSMRSDTTISPLDLGRCLIRSSACNARSLLGSQPNPKHDSVAYAITSPQRRCQRTRRTCASVNFTITSRRARDIRCRGAIACHRTGYRRRSRRRAAAPA